MDIVVFSSLSGIVVLASLFLVFSRDLRNSLLAFLVANFFVGIIFILNNAVFLGFVLMLINIGAVFILFMFAVMMVDFSGTDVKGFGKPYILGTAVLSGFFLFLIIRTVGFNQLLKRNANFDFAVAARKLYSDFPAATVLVGFMVLIVSSAAGILLFSENRKVKKTAGKIELKTNIEIRDGG